MEILGFIVLIVCLIVGVRFGGLGLAAVSGLGLVFFVFVIGMVPGKPPIDVMLTIMAVVTCSGFLQASKGLDVMLKYAEKFVFQTCFTHVYRQIRITELGEKPLPEFRART